jgi:hypothetical protein
VVGCLAGVGVELQAEPMALPAFSRLATLVGAAAPAASRDMATHQATCTTWFVTAAASITRMFNECRHVIDNITTGRFSALEPLCTGESWHGGDPPQGWCWVPVASRVGRACAPSAKQVMPWLARVFMPFSY